MLDMALCACASGLRRVRCCALDASALPGEPALALLDAQAQEATKFFNEKKYTEAEALALKLLDLAPNQRLALRVLFEIRKAQKREQAAEALARRLAGLPGPRRHTLRRQRPIRAISGGPGAPCGGGSAGRGGADGKRRGMPPPSM